MGIEEEAVKSCPFSVAKEADEKEKIFVHVWKCEPSGFKYTEFYTIELRNRQVLECPYALISCLGWNSMVSIGSVVYVVGAKDPELIKFRAKPPGSKFDKKGTYHNCISYLDLTNDTGDGWKPGPCLAEGPSPDPAVVAFGGKIYQFEWSYESKEAKVYDPVMNKWETLLPPSSLGYFSIRYSTSAVADSQNNRILVHFETDKSVYAYYPADNQWELLLQPFNWSSKLVFADGLIIIYLPEDPEFIAAYDIATKQWLNNIFTSDLPERVWRYDFDAMIYLGNGLMSMVCDSPNMSPPQTHIYLINFRIQRSTNNPADLLITLLPEETYTIGTVGFKIRKYLPI